MSRPVSEGAETLLDQYYPVLDHGFIALVDYMGTDQAIEQAARISYGRGTRKTSQTEGLIRYLYRHRHTTPFEMCELKFHVAMPIFVARQWVRHRMACLTGDTKIQFDLPASKNSNTRRVYNLSLQDVWKKFQPTNNATRPDKQRNAFHKRECIQNMSLRSMDENTLQVIPTKIVNIWKSGIKQVFEVTTALGYSIKMSEDHLCLTPVGWKQLKQLSVGDELIRIRPKTKVQSKLKPSYPDLLEEWKPIPGYDALYEISNIGRVRRTGKARGAQVGSIKTPTLSGGRELVSLSRKAISTTHLVHRLVYEAFKGPIPEDSLVRHLDDNPLNNHINNLKIGTEQDNADARRVNGNLTTLIGKPERITSIVKLGKEETYDIEVAGPWHNFSANGYIVHNSINEYSGRYSILPDVFYLPDTWRLQSQNNKQGSSANALAGEDAILADSEAISGHYTSLHRYKTLNSMDVAKELSRIDLPLSSYTQWYWKIDLHNLLHFLKLRCDPHAQYEIRVYADVMAAMVKQIYPMAYRAWIDYSYEAVTLSKQERLAVSESLRHDPLFGNTALKDAGLSARELEEFDKKLMQDIVPTEHSLGDPISTAEAFERLFPNESFTEES